MTQEQLERQLFAAVESADQRFLSVARKNVKTMTLDEARMEAAVAFLSGCNQTAHFLIANDGAVTPQQLEQALKSVGAKMGLHLGPA